MTTIEQTDAETNWYSMSADNVVERLDTGRDQGLDTAEVQRRLEQYGPNEIAAEPPPTLWQTAKGQLLNPMNIMLLVVAVASLAIGQVATGIVVGLLVAFNVVMGTNQQRKASASVEALAELQVPQARVRRAGKVVEIDAIDLVPGDVLLLEAGDLVPADARILNSATLEAQEAALTGESAPVPKDATVLPAGDVALEDRTNLVFQNTQVTRTDDNWRSAGFEFVTGLVAGDRSEGFAGALLTLEHRVDRRADRGRNIAAQGLKAVPFPSARHPTSPSRPDSACGRRDSATCALPATPVLQGIPRLREGLKAVPKGPLVVISTTFLQVRPCVGPSGPTVRETRERIELRSSPHPPRRQPASSNRSAHRRVHCPSPSAREERRR